MNKKQQEPFKQLGARLRTIRQKLHESLAEVSGAVEIDDAALERIEQGHERPSEDILLLLINHFGMQDDEAAGLWQLAGYDQPRSHDHDFSSNNNDEQSPANRNNTAVLVMAVDPRIVYSDGIQVTASNRGVIMTFSQASGTPQSLSTARVGMSREQAYAVIQTLQDALDRSEPRQLPGGSNSTNTSQQTEDKQA
jgi:transcriptional regulator with XRE-family HTH domain